ncbi:SRPBCC domain-containing protein [soil metagenome]
MRPKPVGLSKDAGWELGARRTVVASADAVWQHLIGAGLTTWLGKTKLPDAVGGSYKTADGVTGTLRTRVEGDRLRLTWTRPGTRHETLLQLRVIAKEAGTTIAFHQEKLTGRDERAELLAHWHGVLEDLEAELA